VADPGWCRRSQNGWTLAVHVQPGARRSEVAGLHGDRLRIRIAAPAVDGRANAALEAFVAEALGIAKASVTVSRGERSRQKTVAILDPAARPDRLLGSA
jgi:uncharacterized protein (TIGR00251 family)